MGWSKGAGGTDGANAPKGAVGNISAKEMRKLEERAEVRSDEDTAHWTAVHQQVYDKRETN